MADGVSDGAAGRLDRDPEPRYRRALEADRHRFPSPEQFRHWARHYLSEVDRGDFIRDTLRRYLPDFDPREAHVLDIGCGDAGVPIAFAHAGARAIGLEPAADNTRRAAIRMRDHDVPVTLARGVGEALPFPDEAFNLAILDNVLEHVDDRHATLAEIRRVLRPDGVLYLVTPKPFSIQGLLSDPHYHAPGLVLLPRSWQRRIIERRFGAGSYQVGRIPTRRWLRRALRRHGFQSLVPPRELWVRYVRDRISRPGEIRPGVRRRAAEWLSARDGVFANALVRWILDVGLGANFFIVRKRP